MGFDFHTVEVPDTSDFQNFDKLVVGVLNNVSFSAGQIGQVVSVAVAMGLPPAYAVHVTPDIACKPYVTGKSATGFTVNIAPTGVYGTLTANGSVSTASTTIVMATTVPQWVVPGMNVYDVTAGVQVGTVSSGSGSGTLTLHADAATQGTGTSDSLVIGFNSVGAGTFDVVAIG